MTSGSGVGFTRNPSSGEDRLYADFLLNAQGEDVEPARQAVRQGHRRSHRHTAWFGESFRRFVDGWRFSSAMSRTSSSPSKRASSGCSRPGTQNGLLGLRCRSPVTSWTENLIDPVTAVERLRHVDLDGINRTYLAVPDGTEPLGQGVPAATGVATGRGALSVEMAQRISEDGGRAVLVRDQASTEDITGFAVCSALVTARGGRTSHAAVVARQLGLVCVVSCNGLMLDTQRGRFQVGANHVGEGEVITVDGDRGFVYRGALEVLTEVPHDLIERVRAWRAAFV